jgi:hypothetical protein
MSKIIVFDSDGKLLYNCFSTSFTIYDCRFDDLLNLIPLTEKIKQLAGNSCDLVKIEQKFDIDGFFVGNNFNLIFKDNKKINFSTVLNIGEKNIIINLILTEFIDILLVIINFINTQSYNCYNLIKIKRIIVEENIDIFVNNGFFIEPNSLFITKILDN